MPGEHIKRKNCERERSEVEILSSFFFFLFVKALQEPQDLQKLEQELERQHEEAQEHKADQQGRRGLCEEGWEWVTPHETQFRRMTAWAQLRLSRVSHALYAASDGGEGLVGST